MEVEELLLLLNKVRRSGRGWQAQCPAHDDDSPSLSINLGDDDRILLHCFGGCTTEEIVETLDLTMSDLFPDRDGYDQRY